MEEWKEYKLGEVVISVKDRITTSVLNASSYISTENMLPNKAGVTLSSGIPSGNAIKFVADDILISNIRPYFKKIWQADRIGGCSSDVICLRATNITEPIYLYYLLSQDRFFDYVMQGTKGTKMPRGDRSQIMQWPVLLPSKNKQKKIASILKSLDDKIEVNRKINENLEQQAQALFKSWFVDFEPFKDQPFVESELGMIPEGWRVEPMANIMNFQEGPGIRNWQYVQNSGTKFINIRCIKDGDIYTETANMISNQEANGKYAHFMLQSGDIVMSCSGTLGRYAIVREDHLPLCLNTSVIRFIPISNFDYSFVLGTLTSSYFLNKQIEMACGSVQANFGPTHLKQMKILVPPEAIRTQYNEKCYPIIHLIQKQKYESRRLAELRDTLLPRLMSGELKVDEINL